MFSPLSLFAEFSSQSIVKEHGYKDQGKIGCIPPCIEKERGEDKKCFGCFGQTFFVKVKIDKKGYRQKEKDENI
jgi:hypothetical protein